MGTYYGPDWLKEYYYAITDTKNWLYGPWNENKYNAYVTLSRLYFFGDYMDYLLDVRRDKEYLDRHGMDYSDIHDPRKLHESSSGGNLSMGTLNFVSRNVSRLYR